MDENKLRTVVKEVVAEELKDLIKTINRIYEDREDITNIKTRLGTLEDLYKVVNEELKKIRKDVIADIRDVQSGVSETKDILEKGGE